MSGFLNKMLGRDVAGKLRTIQYLGNARSQDGIAQLNKYLDDDNVEIRRAAARSLEQHWITGNKDAILALTKALDDADKAVRENAALALGEFVSKSPGGKECEAAKQALVRLISSDGDEGVIKKAVLGLAHTNDSAFIGPMVDAFKGKDKKLITMSIDAINDMLPTQARLDMKKALRSIL
jgi:HEAT repeat protein